MTRTGIALATAMLAFACHAFVSTAGADESSATPLWQTDFADTAYGNVPRGWQLKFVTAID